MLDKIKGVGDSLKESVKLDRIQDMGENLRESVRDAGGKLNLGESLRDAGGKLNLGESLRDVGGSLRESVGSASQSLRDKAGTANASVRGSVSSIDVEALIPNQLSAAREPPREKTRLEQAEQEVCSLFPTLSWRQRVIGCISCMVLGYLFSFGSFFRMEALLLGNPVPFVATATLGNIISLCGSCFLTGPTSQAKKMFHASRRVATLLYLGSLALTLVVAFVGKGFSGQGLVLLILMICQYVAIAWYCLSYIPFARELAKRMFSRVYTQVVNDEI